MHNVVAVIPARGGSKGLPRKNILDLKGKPVIAYTIEPAQQAKLVDRVIVCTEDDEIADISRQYGAEIPFMRDPRLAEDHIGCNQVMIWTVNKLFETGHLSAANDIVVYLQPTDLFKRPEWIDECIQALLDDTEADSAFLGCIEHKNFWEKDAGNQYRPMGGKPHPGHDNRQVKPCIYREDTGLGSAIRAYVWTEMQQRLGRKNIVIAKEYELFDLHSKLDLFLAEQYLNYLEENHD